MLNQSIFSTYISIVKSMLYEKVKLTSIEHEQGNSVLPKFCHAALRVYDVVAVNAIYMIKLFRIY